ncbi:MAG: type II toxin-antitoxin system VapC family toxin [Candidatus Eremiobacteraeota bacterium]|nr:type II toxin-antitoxin system VapC family toxin [Candidatus Eremiobacteraeota bacterium]MCW5866939.1 type II toxin-antitoxin system VapC family toxin [Candidatus Eremiobacteraeota bacterium]
MKYLLDTNAVISLLKDDRPGLARRLRQCSPGEVGISAVVAHELYFGAFKSQRVEANLAVVDRLAFEVLELTRADGREAGRVRAGLARLGKPIGPYDVLIAGQALARKLVLVTGNSREFSRVEGLRWEDWE